MARDKYLVDTVLSCGDCHTPRAKDGAPVVGQYLAGVECFVDPHPPASDGQGCVHSANLTSDATGLGKLSDETIDLMLRSGARGDGTFLADVMPYWIFHVLTDADSAAIVAYLRTVPPVAHAVPANGAPFDHPAQARLVAASEMPVATAGGENGRYLATLACVGCHSPDLAPAGLGSPVRRCSCGPSCTTCRRGSTRSNARSSWSRAGSDRLRSDARLLALIPGARFRVLLGGGHAPRSDAPTAIVDLVHEAARAANEGTKAGPLLEAVA